MRANTATRGGAVMSLDTGGPRPQAMTTPTMARVGSALLDSVRAATVAIGRPVSHRGSVATAPGRRDRCRTRPAGAPARRGSASGSHRGEPGGEVLHAVDEAGAQQCRLGGRLD